MVLSVPAHAKVVLEAVNAYTMGDVFYTELNFSEPVSKEEVSVEFINRTVQLDIPDATWAKEPFSRKVEHDRVRSIYTYNANGKSARARLIQKKPFKAEELLGHVEMEEQGNRILVKVFNPSLNMPAKIPPRPTVSRPTIKPIDIASVVDRNGFVKPRQEGAGVTQASVNRLAQELEFRPDPKVEEQKRLAKSMDEAIEKPVEEASKVLGVEPSEEDMPIAEKDEKKALVLEAEEDIPLFSDSEKAKVAEAGDTWTRLLMSFAFIAVFATGLTLFSKWWSKKKTKTLDNNKIRVLNRHHIGPKRELMIVQIAGESLLLGVTDQNINMIKSLSLFDEEIPEISNQKFSEALSGKMDPEEREVSGWATQSLSARQDLPSFYDQKSEVEEEDDDFAVTEVKDIVAARLKNMRNF
tara:strand:- start:27893 stop:29125 length:1233 start_codon:yes stop_codon:yes gene_type:complete